LDKTSHGEARSVKDTPIVGIGQGVARARERFGTEVSEVDAKTLTLVARLLDVEPAHTCPHLITSSTTPA
jgi:hypothetical protein